MSLVGFLCPRDNQNKKFSYCWTKCQKHCNPVPLLMSLSKQNREPESNVYHVTEILSTPQQVYLSRNNDYYVSPNSLVDMHVGSTWHEKIEKTKEFVKELGLEDEYLMEQNFRKYFGIIDGKIHEVKEGEEPWNEEELIILSGTSDLYVKSTKTLWDYKVMKYYWTFKYLSEGKWDDSTIPWQLNIYRVFQYPEAKEIKILCYLKDFKLNMTEKYGLEQVEELQVPMIPDHLVKEKVVSLLTEHVMTQKTCKPRPCTEDEMWNNKVRCTHYCNVRDICKQFAEEK